MLTDFNISTFTNPQVPDYWCSTLPHHTCRTPADRHDNTLFLFPIKNACELQLMDEIVYGLQ
jgi:hypothetical protein